MRHAVALAVLALAGAVSAADSTQTIFERAARALQDGDLAAAERGFRQVLARQPAHVGALGNLAVALSRQERTTEAIAVYRRALKLSSNEPGLLLNLGLAYLKQENYAAAKPLFAKVDSGPMASSQSRELLATCRLYTGEAPAALSLLQTLPRSTGVLFLLGVGYLKTKQRDKAQSVFDELLTSAATPAQAQFLMGKAYADATFFAEAETAFRKAAELDPDLPSVGLELAKTYISLRANEAAERELRAALARNPNDPEAAYYLGALLVRQAREAEALPLLEAARAARPDGWGAWYYLGRAQLQMKNALAAISLLERAAKLNPGESSIYYQLSRAYRATGRVKDAERAEAHRASLPHRALGEGVQSLPSP